MSEEKKEKKEKVGFKQKLLNLEKAVMDLLDDWTSTRPDDEEPDADSADNAESLKDAAGNLKAAAENLEKAIEKSVDGEADGSEQEEAK